MCSPSFAHCNHTAIYPDSAMRRLGRFGQLNSTVGEQLAGGLPPGLLWNAARDESGGVDHESPLDVPPEVEARLIGDFYDKHYRSWPDTPLPALGGRTPRHDGVRG